MLSFWIGLGGFTNGHALGSWLAQRFSDATVSADEDVWDGGGAAQVVWSLQPRPGAADFPVVLELLRFPGEPEDAAEVRVALAALLALELGQPTLVDAGELPSELVHDRNPPFALVFRGSTARAVVNQPSDFYDGHGGLLELDRPLQLALRALDARAELSEAAPHGK